MDKLREYIRKNVTHLPDGRVDWFFIVIGSVTVINAIVLIIMLFREGIL